MATTEFICVTKLEGIPELFQNAVEKEFYRGYNALIEHIDYSAWNDEYDAKYGFNKPMEEGDYEWRRYNRFIARKINATAEKVKPSIFLHYYATSDCQIRAYVKGMKNVTDISFSIKPKK